MAGKPLATLGGIPLWTNPDEVRWNFTMRTVDRSTMGGKVIQVLGTTLSDLTIKGAFGKGDPRYDGGEGWRSQLRFREQVRAWADQAINQHSPKPIVFTYAPRNWRFNVFVKSVSRVSLTEEEINPKWELVLFPLEEGTRDVVRGIKDLYIKRLMNGVGWKQTDYNGPTQREVDDLLAPAQGSVHEYLEQQTEQAFIEGTSQ